MATLTVLGTFSGAPVAESGCSSYLVSHDGTALVLDCGPGTIGRLRGAIGVHELEAVFITHMHTDHFLDLVPLNSALHTEPPPTGREQRRLPVFLPPGGLETVVATFHGLTVNVGGGMAGRYAEVLDLREYTPGEPLAVGSMTVTPVGPLRHAAVDYGFRVVANGSVLAYTGDTAPCDAAVELGRGSDLFLAESTYPEPGPNPAALHSSARELGEMAARAACRRLIATHFAPTHWPQDAAAREAAVTACVRAGGYQGEIAVAAAGRQFAF